ncbi:hypothetical protein IFM89_032147 [Coptis chinensis]|uniref:Uncharacterized protein n=1 Tax=Coptis chinensis TaxID=261450 RepID=A0A835IZF0_9MAGN|nr:hypothetical protein IFM89_032147 [Coptis chinensis]
MFAYDQLRVLISLGDPEYHQQTLANLKLAVKSTKKLYAGSEILIFILLSGHVGYSGTEFQVVNVTEDAISLVADGFVVLTPNRDQKSTSELLPINFDGLAKAVKKGDAMTL